MPKKHITAAVALGMFITAGLFPALAVPRWVPLPVAKSDAMTGFRFAGDSSRGTAVFGKCQACHALGDEDGHLVGPTLTGIVGRPAAVYKNYEYSGALAKAGKEGLIWTRDFLHEYLEAPSKFMPEGKMAFVGIADAVEREDLIAFLATQKPPKSAPWLFKNQSRADIPLPTRSPQ